MVANVLELNHQMTPQLLIDDSHWDRAGLVLQEVSIVSRLQLHLQI